MAFDPSRPFQIVAEFDPAKPFKKVSPGAMGEALGVITTLNRSIPFADEVADAVQAGVDIVAGRSKPGEAWRKARARSKASSEDFEDRRPIAANLTKGGGIALQAIPAALAAPATGGASLAPIAQSAGLRGLLGSSARSAVTAGLSAQAAGYGGEGTLAERQNVANAATLPAMAIGAAAPVVLAGAGAARRKLTDAGKSAGRATARVANRVVGEENRFLDPRNEAAKRLGEALKADGLGPQEVRVALDEWRRTGASSPALMDLAGENTRALLRSAASKPGAARNTAVQYARQVAGDLQGNVIDRTRALTPDPRSLPEIERQIGRRISAASAVDDVPPGSGGAAISEALNSRRDAAMGRVNAAFGQAREAGKGVTIPREEVPVFAGRLREAVADFVPESIPNTRRALSVLDETGGSTEIRDIFGVRQMLSNLRGQPGPEAAAAGRAVREIDAFVDDAMERGLFAGDDEAAQLWRNAIGERARFGRAFEGDDLVARLTGRERHGEAVARAVAPEDATNAILGRNGVAARPDLTRDLARVRDMLGADSPEWAQFQRESMARLLGRDAGTDEFGNAFQGFARQNPELADILASPQQRAALAAAREQIADAVAERGALETGRNVLTATPDRLFEHGPPRPIAQVGAAREIEDAVGRPRDGATGVLNTLAASTRTRRNLSEVFGPEEAARFQDAIGREIDRLSHARFISPNDGSQTAIRVTDDALIDMPPMTKLGVLRAIIDKARRGVTLTDQERAALLELGTTVVRTGDDLPAIPISEQAQRLLTPAQRARIARVLSAGEGARRGGER